MTFANPDDDALRALLTRVKTIAVVGLSPQPARPSYRVAQAMQRYGYRIVPVRPLVDAVLGEKAYATLEEVPEKIDLVNIFRRSEFVRPVVESAIRINAKTVWMQETVEDEAAARLARKAGLAVMMDSCIMREHARWLRDRKS